MSSMVNVAREANVAVSTVSLTLNHRERVAPETRDRIELAMKRLGYRPRKIREGARKDTPIRAAFIYTLQSLSPAGEPGMSSYCREVISGMQESIGGTSSSLTIFRGVEHVDHDLMVNEQITAGEFDGVVLFGADPSNGYLERLQQAQIPLVVMNRPPEHGRYSCVTLDYYGGAQLAIKHLLSLGHRRIALTLNDKSDKWLVREMCEGTKDALAAHGLEPVLFECGWEDSTPPGQLEVFCKEVIEKKVTAIFTGDHLLVEFVDVLASMGIRVPEDISIIGFDDRGLTTSSGLSLTTIGYDKRRMGRMAIRILQQLAQANGKLRWLGGAVSTHLVKGQTTAEIAVSQRS